MAYSKLFAIKPGDKMVAYAGFSCLAAGAVVTIGADNVGLFFPCADGHHYLASQMDADGVCLGLTPLLL